MINTIKSSISIKQKKYLKYYYYNFIGSAGIRKSPCLYEIDRKIEPYIKPASHQGVFIEAGGNDGITQSNTFHLEKYYRWSGFIVEPIPWLNELAQRFRRCGIETCALGRFSDRGAKLRLEESDLTTRVSTNADVCERVIEVPVEPLSDLLDRRGIAEVDFFSLDVEGYENAVLEGIDFDKHSIKALLVETKDLSGLSLDWRRYQEPIPITHHDYLILMKPS